MTQLLAATEPTETTSLPTCPDCEGALVNVQGMLHCDACNWFDAR